MPNNVAAQMQATIIIDKKDLVSKALEAYAVAQKEIEGNKIELLVDISDDKAISHLKELSRELSGKDYIIRFKNQGIEETLKSLDELFEKIKFIISGKVFGVGNGVGNSIINEDTLKTVINLFGDVKSYLGDMKKIISDVGDGEEFSPLLKMIKEVQKAISDLSDSISKISLNLNVDVGNINDEKLNAKISQANFRQLEAYRKLFASMKKTGHTNMDMLKFFEPPEASVSELIGIYKNIIQKIEKEVYGKRNINPKNRFESEYKEIKNAQQAFNRATKTQKTNNPLAELFGSGTGDLTEVISKLDLIVSRLEEICKVSIQFKTLFDNGFTLKTPIDEIEKLTQKIKELEDELARVKNSSNPIVPKPNETNISSSQKSHTDTSVIDSVKESVDALSDEKKGFDSVGESAKNASKAKDEFTKSNRDAKESADETSKSAKDEADALQEVNSQVNKWKNESSRYTGRLDVFESRANQSQQYKNAIDKLKTSIKSLNDYIDTTSKMSVLPKDAASKYEELRKSVEDNVKVLRFMDSAARGSSELDRGKEIDKITKYLDQNTKISKKAREQLESYLAVLRTKGADANIKEIHTRFLEISAAERQAGREGKKFLDIFKDKVVFNFAAQLVGYYLSMTDFIRYGRAVIDNVIEIDTKITELRKVSNATENRLTQNFNASADAAKDLGASISDVISATADWSRMGYDVDDAEELAKISTLYKNVGDGIDIETANNSLISTLQGYQLAADDAIGVIDKFNEVANNFAIDSAGIGEALQRSAASFNAANTDLSKSIALITATNEVVQDPDSVGKHNCPPLQ